jgi:hypothetical protein
VDEDEDNDEDVAWCWRCAAVGDSRDEDVIFDVFLLFKLTD